MLRAISSYVNIKDRLHPGLLDGYARAGAEAIEIFAAKGHFNYDDRSHVRELAGWFKDSDVGVNSVHSPMFRDEHWSAHMSEPINFIDPDKRRRQYELPNASYPSHAHADAPFFSFRMITNCTPAANPIARAA